jgi:hypothetical protein
MSEQYRLLRSDPTFGLSKIPTYVAVWTSHDPKNDMTSCYRMMRLKKVKEANCHRIFNTAHFPRVSVLVRLISLSYANISSFTSAFCINVCS